MPVHYDKVSLEKSQFPDSIDFCTPAAGSLEFMLFHNWLFARSPLSFFFPNLMQNVLSKTGIKHANRDIISLRNVSAVFLSPQDSFLLYGVKDPLSPPAAALPSLNCLLNYLNI